MYRYVYTEMMSNIFVKQKLYISLLKFCQPPAFTKKLGKADSLKQYLRFSVFFQQLNANIKCLYSIRKCLFLIFLSSSYAWIDCLPSNYHSTNYSTILSNIKISWLR